MYQVLPASLADRLAGCTLSARRPMGGSQQGAHRSRRHGASVEFAEYRSYVPGDPPQRIDWAAYARSDRHLVRRMEEETNLTGVVLLDVSESMRWQGLGPVGKLAWASSLAASLLYVLVRQADRAGLLLLGDRVLARHPWAGSVAALRPALEALDRPPAGGRGDLAAAVEEAAATLPRRSLVLLVSDLLQEPERVLRSVQRLHHDGHDVRVLQVADRSELILPQEGLCELQDLESGERLEADLDELRPAYRQAVEEHIETLRRGLAAVGAVHRLCDTAEEIDAVLRGMG